jgi:transcription elongation factor S-II
VLALKRGGGSGIHVLGRMAAEQAQGDELRVFVAKEIAERAGIDELLAQDMEIGVYNWALESAAARRVALTWANPRFRTIYEAKARSIACNVDPVSYVGNARLVQRLKEGEFKPHEVAFMNPENVFPERWRHVIDMKLQRDAYITNARPAAMTDQFKCGRCKKRECSYMELQTRSCDEPASIFVLCHCCGNRWRLG